jgi:hypothetical protein
MDWSSVYVEDGDTLLELFQGRVSRQQHIVKVDTYSSFIAYAFSINYILGVGLLGVCASILHSALLCSTGPKPSRMMLSWCAHVDSLHCDSHSASLLCYAMFPHLCDSCF